MPKVICTRPNASLNINGVKFTPTEDGVGVISDEISNDAAELFLSIPGYELAEEGEKKPAQKAAPAAKAIAAKPAAKKAAPAPAPVQEPAPEAPAAASAADDSEGASETSDTGVQDTDTGAGKGDGADDPNVF